MARRVPWSAVALAALATLALASLAALAGPADGLAVEPNDRSLDDPVYGYGTATVGDTAYLVGGAHARDNHTAQILAMGPNGAVETVAELSQPLLEPAVAAVGSDVYVFGGAAEPQGGIPQTQDTIHRFDTASGEVETLVATSLPEPVSSASAIAVDGDIYVLGGLSLQESGDGAELDWLDTVWRFDPSGPSIEETDATLPTGRGQMASVPLDGGGFLFGGMAETGSNHTCDGSSSCATDAVLHFDASPLGVSPVGDLPERLRWSAAAVHEDTAYVMGGCRADCGPRFGSASIVAVDTGTANARELPVTMPDKGGRYAAAAIDDTALVAGGSTVEDSISQVTDRVREIQLGATPPWAPTDVSVEAVDDGSASLDWDTPPYDGGAPVTEYRVLRSADAKAPRVVATVGTTGFTDHGLDTGTTYAYHVRAVNAAGAGTPSQTVTHYASSTPNAPEITVQGADERLVVQWSTPTETGGGNITGYRVMAFPPGETPSGCEEASCRDLQPGIHHYELTSVDGEAVENGDTYAVQVRAENEHGWGPPSDAIEATARALPDPPDDVRVADTHANGQATVNITWDAEFAADGYVVYRGRSVGSLERLTTTNTLTISDEGVPRGQDLVYAVASTEGDREGALSQSVRTVFPETPAPVVNLTARWEGGEAIVTWDPPSDTGGVPLDGFDVARSRGSMDPAELEGTLAEVTRPVFRDGEAPRGGPVTYYVRATSEAGVGEWSTTQLRVPSSTTDTPPDAVLSARPGTADVGQTVFFDGSGSSDESGIEAYRFTFGDGSDTGWSSNPRATHAYDERGIFTAELEVRDPDGGVSQPATATIAVGPEDQPDTDDGGEDPDDTPLAPGLAVVAISAAALAARRR